MQPTDGRTRVVFDVATGGAAFLLVWLAVAYANAFEAPVLPSVAVGLALGLLVRALKRWRWVAHVATMALAVFVCGLAAADQRCHFSDGVELPAIPPLRQVFVLTTRLAPTLVAFAGLGLGARAPAFVLGVAAVALQTRWGIPLGPALVLLAFACVRWIGTRDEGTSSRLRVALVGLGALATLGVLGLVHDLTAMELARTVEVQYERWVHLDSASDLGLRVCAEVLLIAGVAWMARGRTAGLMMVLMATPMLLPTIVGWGHAAWWGGECVRWYHPLDRAPCFGLVFGLSLALLPWLGPLWRQHRVLFGSELART